LLGPPVMDRASPFATVTSHRTKAPKPGCLPLHQVLFENFYKNTPNGRWHLISSWTKFVSM
jgi:hypothetical protein